MGKLETDYQKHLKDEIKRRLPGAVVTKQDPNDIQGIPDLAVFYGCTYAWLEVKRHAKAPHRPNQPFYVAKAKEQAFGATIYPENEEEVLNAMEQTLRARGEACILKS